MEVLAIPYEGTTLPGYFMQPAGYSGPRKTLIMHSGYDGTAEEIHDALVAAATPDVLTKVPEDTANLLLFVGRPDAGP